MKMITTAELRKQKEKTKLNDETLIVAAMTTEVSVRADDAESGEGESRIIDFTISNETADSYKDVVSADGWNLDRFIKNPVVLWAHNRGLLPVGKATEVRVEGESLMASAEFATQELNPFAENVFQMLKAGFLKAVSVGFIPLEWTWDDERGGYNFLKNELFEFSVVPVPANPDALQNALRSGLDLGPLKEWCEETLDLWRPDGHVAMWVPRSSVELVHQVTASDAAGWTFKETTSSGDVTMAGLNVTPAGGTYEATITEDPYNEFWSPNAKDHDDGSTTSWTYSNASIDYELRAEVAKLQKTIDALTEKLDAMAEPAKDPQISGGDVELDIDEDVIRILLDEEPDDDVLIDSPAGSDAGDDDPDGDAAAGFDPDVLREAVRELAGDAITKRTGKLPKEV